MAKRAFDFAVASVALFLVWPVLVLFMLFVKWDSPGPAIFSQERIGRSFRRFRLLKLRSMTANNTGSALTCGADQRITRVGKFIRKYKIDELPQLWNVLVGDMSVVGPRPEVPQFAFMFYREFASVLAVRPGLTGVASIKYHAESDLLGQADDPAEYYVNVILPDKLRLEMEYVSAKSLRRDLALIFATVRACLKP